MKNKDLKTLRSYLVSDGQLKPEFSDKGHVEIAEMLSGVAPNEVDRDSVESTLLLAQFTIKDVAALEPSQLEWIKLLCSQPVVLLTNPVKRQLEKIVGETDGKLGNRLARITTRPGTVYESLGIPRPNESDVADAILRTE